MCTSVCLFFVNFISSCSPIALTRLVESLMHYIPQPEIQLLKTQQHHISLTPPPPTTTIQVPAGGRIFDHSSKWYESSPQGEGIDAYQVSSSHQLFRFFDSDMHFEDQALCQLVRGLQRASPVQRERWFLGTIGARRRLTRKVEETALARVFNQRDEWSYMKQLAQAVFMRKSIKRLKLSVWDCFNTFDADDNGLLTPEEIFGAIRWLKVPNMDAEDVVDFVRAFDKNRDNCIGYKEFADMLRDPMKTNEDNEDEDEEVSKKERVNLKGLENEKIVPFGKDELRAIFLTRKRAEAKRQRDYLAELNLQNNKPEERLKSKRKKGDESNMSNPDVDLVLKKASYDFGGGYKPMGVRAIGQHSFVKLRDKIKRSEDEKKIPTYLQCSEGCVLSLRPPPKLVASNLTIWTITMDVKFNSLPSRGNVALLMRTGGDGADSLYVNSEGSVGTQSSFGSLKALSSNRWATVTVSRKDGKMSVFVNGTLSQSDLKSTSSLSSSKKCVFLFGHKDEKKNRCQGGSIRGLDLYANNAHGGNQVRESIDADYNFVLETRYANLCKVYGKSAVRSTLSKFMSLRPKPCSDAAFVMKLDEIGGSSLDEAYTKSIASLSGRK